MTYSPECRYCIEHARKRLEEHQQEIERLQSELAALKTKMSCQDEFIDKLLLLIKSQPQKRVVSTGGTPGAGPVLQAPNPRVTAVIDAPYHQ